MAKFTWKEAEEDDPIFKQGWVLSSPNLSKPRPKSTERTEDGDTKSTNDSTNVNSIKEENNEVHTQNSKRKQSDFQTKVHNIAFSLRSKARTIKNKILRRYRWTKEKIIAIYKD